MKFQPSSSINFGDMSGVPK